MAKRDSTSKARPRRKQSVASRKASKATPVVLNTLSRAVEDAIEAERARLMTAHTLLSCAALAIDAEDLSFEGPHYLTVLELTRDLVNEAINNLEPMFLMAATEEPDEAEDAFEEDELDIVPRSRYRVREPVSEYLTH